MPDHDCLLTIDFGTSYFKTAVVDRQGELLCIDRVPTPIRRDDNHSEIDPGVFRRTVRDAIARLRADSPDAIRRVRGVTFCTQANSFVLLNDVAEPVTPIIVWNDSRAAALTAALADRLPDDHRVRSGLPALADSLAVVKLNWLRLFQPEVFATAKQLLFIGDYFVHWLTGRSVTDPSVAAISALFDLHTGDWSADWCERLGIDRRWLPQLAPAGTAVETIRPAVADELRLPRDCVVTSGVIDQYAAAVGVGNRSAGDMSETTGTVLATIRCSHSPAAPSPDVLVGPAATRGHFYHMAVSDHSASLLEHYRRHLKDGPTFETLDTLLPGVPLHLDATAKVSDLKLTLANWSTDTDRGSVVAAVYQVVADALKRQVTALLDDELPPAFIRSAGGASRSRRWLQIKANTLGLPLLEPQSREPTLLGVASLAARSLGWQPIAGGDVRPSNLVQPQTGSVA